MGYIDIHSHIVPGIDDGSKSNRESVEMLKLAYEAGITTVIATPHYSKGYSEYKADDIIKYCKAIEKYAQEHICPEFRVYAGQEILYNDKSLEMIQNGEVIPLANSNYILLEFEPTVTYTEMYRALREIAMTMYFPVLAHVERYACLRDRDKLEELHNLGVMYQMNYAHIHGKLFDTDAKWCRQMLNAGLIDVLSTDMHNTDTRGPRMEEALAWMEKHLDEEYIAQITSLNAQSIIGHKEKKEEQNEQQ